MAKVIEFYVQKNFRNAFVRAGQPPTGNGYRVFFAGKEVSPDSTSRRGPRVAPGSDGVEPYYRK
jgi:hypothetical protein